MKNEIIILGALVTTTLHAAAQGSLTPPPGAPAPTMKSLDQVEARIPLVAGQPGVSVTAAGTITISASGSYYLTKNITITTNVDGLVINADATVDLNGFGIIGTAAAITTADAIVISTSSNATIRNGFIKGGTTLTGVSYSPAGFEMGVFADFLAVGARSSVTVCDLTVTGVRNTGIYLRRLGQVDRCTVQGVGGNGIDVAQWSRPDTASFDPRYQSLVRDSHASDCGGQYGIAASRVSGSFGHTNRAGGDYQGAGCGIVATMVENSTGWATAQADNLFQSYAYGIHCFTASYCSGRGTATAIRADDAIACHSFGGVIEAQKHLGTP